MSIKIMFSFFLVMEMIMGTIVVLIGGGMFGHTPNIYFVVLGILIFLLHALEYLLLFKMK